MLDVIMYKTNKDKCLCVKKLCKIHSFANFCASVREFGTVNWYEGVVSWVVFSFSF